MSSCDSSVFWADIQGKPATFPPAPHTHVPADIIGLEEFILQYIPDVQPIIRFPGDPDRAPLEGESIVSINEATGELFGWNGASWLNQREVDIGAVPPVAAPTFGNRLYLEVVNDNAQMYAWDGDEWIALGGVSLVDNADGTYTYTDANGSVTIDTRASSNPVQDIDNNYTSSPKNSESLFKEIAETRTGLVGSGSPNTFDTLTQVSPSSLTSQSFFYLFDNSKPTVAEKNIKVSFDDVAAEIGVQIGNSLFVSKNGDDGTATRGSLSKQYLTINAAWNDAQDGDTIYVFAGTYDEAGIVESGLLTDKTINITLENGAIWETTAAVPLLDYDLTGLASINLTVNVKGGLLRKNSGAADMFISSGSPAGNPTLRMSFENATVETTVGSIMSGVRQSLSDSKNSSFTSTSGDCFRCLGVGEIKDCKFSASLFCLRYNTVTSFFNCEFESLSGICVYPLNANDTTLDYCKLKALTGCIETNTRDLILNHCTLENSSGSVLIDTRQVYMANCLINTATTVNQGGNTSIKLSNSNVEVQTGGFAFVATSGTVESEVYNTTVNFKIAVNPDLFSDPGTPRNVYVHNVGANLGTGTIGVNITEASGSTQNQFNLTLP